MFLVILQLWSYWFVWSQGSWLYHDKCFEIWNVLGISNETVALLVLGFGIGKCLKCASVEIIWSGWTPQHVRLIEGSKRKHVAPASLNSQSLPFSPSPFYPFICYLVCLKLAVLQESLPLAFTFLSLTSTLTHSHTCGIDLPIIQELKPHIRPSIYLNSLDESFRIVIF